MKNKVSNLLSFFSTLKLLPYSTHAVDFQNTKVISVVTLRRIGEFGIVFFCLGEPTVKTKFKIIFTYN